MRRALFIILLVGIAGACTAQERRYLLYTDTAGVEHRVEIDTDSRVVVERQDESREADIVYFDGGLFSVATYRPDGSDEALIFYEDGGLFSVETSRPDESREALIFYENGGLDWVATYRPDESREALIGYENGGLDGVITERPDGSAEAGIVYKDGVINTMELANPFNPEIAIKGIYNIASGSPVCQ